MHFNVTQNSDTVHGDGYLISEKQYSMSRTRMTKINNHVPVCVMKLDVNNIGAIPL